MGEGSEATWQSDLEILVISLPVSERLPETVAKLEEAHLVFSVLEAVSGEQLSRSDIQRLVDQHAARVHFGSELSPGQIGCALSHNRAYQVAAQRGARWTVVLEDDAVITKAFVLLLKSLVQWDTPKPVMVSLFSKGRVSPRRRTTLPGDLDAPMHEIPPRIRGLRWPPASAVAYAMNQPALEVANLWTATHRVSSRADWPPWAAQTLCFLAEDECVHHKDGQSTIEGARPSASGIRRVISGINKLLAIPFFRAPAPYDSSLRRYLQVAWLPSIQWTLRQSRANLTRTLTDPLCRTRRNRVEGEPPMSK